ncbi:MAG: Crp/Fnr family transcriptional regulator [Spirochaetales bacterium]|nr:Crp/Fnr family transcriptional regulator [Spirochaetales bacterium]
MDDYNYFFSSIERWQAVNTEHKILAEKYWKPRTYKQNEYVQRAGEKAGGMGFIVKGLFRFFYIDNEGREHVKTFASEGEYVTSFAALITGEPSSYFIQAIEDSRILFIDRQNYLQGIEQNSLWNTMARKTIENVLIEKVHHESCLLTMDASERYEDFVMRYPDLNNRLRLKDIASYLGMTDVSLSRIRKIRS